MESKLQCEDLSLRCPSWLVFADTFTGNGSIAPNRRYRAGIMLERMTRKLPAKT